MNETRAQRAIRIVKEYSPNLSDPADIAVAAIEYDISDRKDLGHYWDEISDTVRDENIKPAWAAIVREMYKSR